MSKSSMDIVFVERHVYVKEYKSWLNFQGLGIFKLRKGVFSLELSNKTCYQSKDLDALLLHIIEDNNWHEVDTPEEQNRYL